MSFRIPPCGRQAIIGFPESPKHGEITKLYAEHQVSIPGFYKIQAQAAREGPEAAAPWRVLLGLTATPGNLSRRSTP